MQTNVTISCHVTLDITKCMWYPHQNNEHPPSNRNPWSLNVLDKHISIAQVSFKSWGTFLKLTHECMNVHIPHNDDNTIHLLMNNRSLIPIIPSQFASNSHHHIIIKVYIQARYNNTLIIIKHEHHNSSSLINF
ncbi:hypothetical protein QL285_043485 [Trifolium repens]|nr:hypothetical protein QL285_043485 [Trifolium repens]